MDQTNRAYFLKFHKAQSNLISKNTFYDDTLRLHGLANSLPKVNILSLFKSIM